MANACTNKIFMDRDMQKTVRNIVTAVDRAYIKTVDLSEFEKGLIEEVHFLVPYSHEEMRQAENYIHQYLQELYQLAHSLQEA